MNKPNPDIYYNPPAFNPHAVQATPTFTEVEAFPVPPSDFSAPPTPPVVNSSQQMPNINTIAAKEYLATHHWPKGLQETFVQNLTKIALRVFICDDSGSMAGNDGHKLLGNNNNKRMVSCTRWSELTESLRFHAGLAKAAGALTEFRLLNGSAPIVIGSGDVEEESRHEALMSLLNDSPGGGTPLCRHVREVIEKIRPMEAQLRANGQKVCVIIASDGESSDGNVAEAMRPLRSLPVWVVIRLCTDEDRIVEYWNNIDNELELEMDVLDDLCGEAEEIFNVNPWLTYGEPLHRMREFGIPLKELDLIDEARLSPEQIRKVCSIILGGQVDIDYPHPELDMKGFFSAVERHAKQVSKTWDPMTKTMHDWINMNQLRRTVRKDCKSGCVIC